jgi:uncharacterized protein YndB with AHSA1/START domain
MHMLKALTIVPLLAAMLGGCAAAERSPKGERPMDTQSATAVTTPSDVEIVVQHSFSAPRQRVWEAWTSCEHLREWMLGPPGWSMAVCELDLRPGGSQRLVWRDPQGTEMEIRGTYQEVRPPLRLIVREAWGGDWPETTNTLSLSEIGGQTTMVLTIRYPSKEARDAAIATGMTDGMAHTFQLAGEYIQSMR